MASSDAEFDATAVICDPFPNITTISSPFKRGIFKAGGRATIVRLTSGNLAVFSPSRLTPAVRAKVAALLSPSPSPSSAQAQATTSVAYLIAPDLEHHMSLHAWHAAYPTAAVIAPEGLAEKRAKSRAYARQGGVPIAHTLTAAGAGSPQGIRISEEFDRDFDVEFAHGHLNKEIVLLHRPSRTLIEADLLWNLPPTEQYSLTPGGAEGGIVQRLATWAFGASGQALGQRRLLWWGIAKDRASLSQSAKRINGWDFDNLIPCHGDIIKGGAKDVFQRVFRWHIDA